MAEQNYIATWNIGVESFTFNTLHVTPGPTLSIFCEGKQIWEDFKFGVESFMFSIFHVTPEQTLSKFYEDKQM